MSDCDAICPANAVCNMDCTHATCSLFCDVGAVCTLTCFQAGATCRGPGNCLDESCF
jgi:hypothetical protein